MSSAITYSASAPATQMKCLLMQKNDVLDVTVGYGSDNSYTSDTTSIIILIFLLFQYLIITKIRCYSINQFHMF